MIKDPEMSETLAQGEVVAEGTQEGTVESQATGGEIIAEVDADGMRKIPDIVIQAAEKELELFDQSWDNENYEGSYQSALKLLEYNLGKEADRLIFYNLSCIFSLQGWMKDSCDLIEKGTISGCTENSLSTSNDVLRDLFVNTLLDGGEEYTDEEVHIMYKRIRKKMRRAFGSNDLDFDNDNVNDLISLFDQGGGTLDFHEFCKTMKKLEVEDKELDDLVSDVDEESGERNIDIEEFKNFVITHVEEMMLILSVLIHGVCTDINRLNSMPAITDKSGDKSVTSEKSSSSGNNGKRTKENKTSALKRSKTAVKEAKRAMKAKKRNEMKEAREAEKNAIRQHRQQRQSDSSSQPQNHRKQKSQDSSK